MAGIRTWRLTAREGRAAAAAHVLVPGLPAWLARYRLLVQAGIFVLGVVAAVEVGSLVAATGGLPNAYVHLFYPLLVCTAFALPAWAGMLLALWAGLIPSHEGFLLVSAVSDGGLDNLVRPLTFVLVSGLVASMSHALRRQAEKEMQYAQLLQAEMERAEDSWQALQRSEEKYRTLVNTMDEVLVALDTEGRITEVNAAFERLTGWSRQEVLGKHFSHLVPPSAAGRLGRDFRRIIEQGGSGKLHDLSIRTRSGSWVTVEGTCAVLMSQGEPVGVVATAHDVSERRRAEEERAQLLRRLLLAQDEERRRVSYDFHDGPVQLMAAAHSFLDAYRAKHPYQGADHPIGLAHRYLSEALEEARRIISLLRPKELEEHGLAGALRCLADDVRERSGIETEVETNVEGLRLEPHVESALFRIAQEAVSNAVRHSGTRRLRVSLEQRGDELVLTVRDWGKGLPEGGLVGGRAAGVGLESMRDRARLLGARFDIRSRAGEGTEVTVALPLRKAEPCQ